MRVLKFGGGCLKDLVSLKKLLPIVKEYDSQMIIVVSAFGKLTNSLEEIYKSTDRNFNSIQSFFQKIMVDLGFSNQTIERILIELRQLVSRDQLSESSVLSVGELISSKILSTYFSELNFYHTLINAPDIIKTNNIGSSATINLEETIRQKDIYLENFSHNLTLPILTQGFIGSFGDNREFTITCLGREGSDYSAAIFGNIFNAQEVILFKDVDGIYNSDPKKDKNAELFLNLSYKSAFEICNHKNTVVHPQTICLLEQKGIPLIIKNFYNLDGPGTIIS